MYAFPARATTTSSGGRTKAILLQPKVRVSRVRAGKHTREGSLLPMVK